MHSKVIRLLTWHNKWFRFC